MRVLLGLVFDIMGSEWRLAVELDVLTLLPDRALLMLRSASRRTEGGHRIPTPLDEPKKEADLKADSVFVKEKQRGERHVIDHMSAL